MILHWHFAAVKEHNIRSVAYQRRDSGHRGTIGGGECLHGLVGVRVLALVAPG